MRRLLSRLGAIVAVSLFWSAQAKAAGDEAPGHIERVVNDVIRPVMAAYDVPGMAIAVTVDGKHYLFNYGVASRESGQKVTDKTLFEIGSISKTFTATLGAYAEIRGTLSFNDKVKQRLPALAGSAFDEVSLLDLATYTAGGLPLQFPEEVTDEAKMIAYYKSWHPAYATGSYRLYSNPSIGLFGYLAARSMGTPFDDLMAETLLPKLGLTHTYIKVPQEQMGNYAYGYSTDDKPIRMRPGMLASEAYGVKTTASDMIRFVELNIDASALDEDLRRAIAATHIGYAKAGSMSQGLGWEMYAYPTDLQLLLDGNSAAMAFRPNKATRLEPPAPSSGNMLINKTGSTKGFGAYAVFVPAQRIGVVLLANRNFPIPARVKAAHRILSALDTAP